MKRLRKCLGCDKVGGGMELHEFEFLPLDGQVDEKSGVIKDVSVITSGVEAKGHKLHTDMTTLEQMRDCATEAVQVPVKWNHKTGADAVNGFLTNFKIVGDKLKADWHLLKKHERYEQALELAQKMPKGVGLSASFKGLSEKVGDKMFARCSALPCVDLVASPAANPDGLFSEGDLGDDGVDMGGVDMSDTNKNPASGNEGNVVDFSAALEAIQSGIEVIGLRLDAVEEFSSEVSDAINLEAEAEAGLEAQHQFAEGEDPVAYLEGRLADDAAAREFAAHEEARDEQLNELNEKLEQVLELNESLALQNQAMANTLSELTDAPLEFSAGADGAVELNIVEGGAGQSEFSARVEQLKSEGKDACEAISFAIGEDEDRYTQHLEESGALV
jgi:hypothetical protein